MCSVGEKGSLAHVLVHESMLPAIIGMAIGTLIPTPRGPIAFEYPLENKPSGNKATGTRQRLTRSSDHDPILTVIDSTQTKLAKANATIERYDSLCHFGFVKLRYKSHSTHRFARSQSMQRKCYWTRKIKR